MAASRAKSIIDGFAGGFGTQLATRGRGGLQEKAALHTYL
jgi:hypothetical protein